METDKRQSLLDELSRLSSKACDKAYELGYDNIHEATKDTIPLVEKAVENWTKDMTRDELISTISLLAVDDHYAWLPSNNDIYYHED